MAASEGETIRVQEASTEQALVVGSKGLTYADVLAQLVALFTFAVALAWILFLTPGGPDQQTALKAGLVVGVTIFADLLVEGVTSVRSVEIDSTGVPFRYIFNLAFTPRLYWAK
jgi:multisubunit Na+/H+ antiporter MnhB subunit